MMNYIWAGMIIIGLFFSCINNNISGFTDGLMESCTEALMFIFSIAGVMAMWSGLMKIAEASGLIHWICKRTKRIMGTLFPGVKSEDTIAMMLMSFIANIFGAGNSTTVFSLKAMEMLDRENGHSQEASNAMCMFLAVSMSMIQIIPTTVIKIRTDLGSQSPSDIIIPSIVAGLCSMVASILICKIIEKRKKHV